MPSKTKNVWDAEMALREMGTPSLGDALDYLSLLAEEKPERLEAAAVLVARAGSYSSLRDDPKRISTLALAALASLVAGERDAVGAFPSFDASRPPDACAPDDLSLQPRFDAHPTQIAQGPRSEIPVFAHSASAAPRT